MYLTPDEDRLIRDWILDGRSDEEIAHTLLISVKLVRPIRTALEQVMRPR